MSYRFAPAPALVGVLLAASVSAGTASAACQLRQLAQFHVPSARNRPLIDAEINGKPVHFLMDLGSQKSLIFANGAKQIDLEVGPLPPDYSMTFYGVGGSVPAGSVRISQFKLGGFSKPNFDMVALPGGGTAADAPIGLLGQDFFTNFDVELDFAHDAVRLFKPEGCTGDQVVYWPNPYAEAGSDVSGLKFQVKLNGQPLFAQLDTGSTFSYVTAEAARRAGVAPAAPDPKDGKGVVGLASKKVVIQLAHFDSFALGQETISNTTLPLGDLFGADKEVRTGSHISQDVVETPEMLLGMDFLKAHRIYIAESQHKIYASYLGGPVFSPAGSEPR